jgi:hypothetical protein
VLGAHPFSSCAIFMSYERSKKTKLVPAAKSVARRR